MPLFKKTKINKPSTQTSNKTYKITKKTNKTKASKSSAIHGLDKYHIPINTDIVHPKYWELPNRKHF